MIDLDILLLRIRLITKWFDDFIRREGELIWDRVLCGEEREVEEWKTGVKMNGGFE